MSAVARRMKVIEPPAVVPHCVGCDVLIQKDETNEQNIDHHRLEMAERWRLQEVANNKVDEGLLKLTDVMAGHVRQLNESLTIHLEKIHKLEKNIIYAAIGTAVSAIAVIGSRLIP